MKSNAWSRVFPNQAYGRQNLKHNKYPVYITDEFDFFRCVEFNDSFYGKNVFELHYGNLRTCNTTNRYSGLFPKQKLSYWADSISTARKEIKKHGASNNIITFWSYDDATSTFPIIDNDEPLIIIDGRDIKFHEILEHYEKNGKLNSTEQRIVDDIIELKPDCLAYWSIADEGHVNYLFFEKGFNKLSIRQVRLRLGNQFGKNTNRIVCADSCDYTPFPKSYGECFMPLAKVKLDDEYLQTSDYKEKCRVLENSHKRFR